MASGKRNSHVVVKFALKGGEPARIGGREHAAGRARRGAVERQRQRVARRCGPGRPPARLRARRCKRDCKSGARKLALACGFHAPSMSGERCRGASIRRRTYGANTCSPQGHPRSRSGRSARSGSHARSSCSRATPPSTGRSTGTSKPDALLQAERPCVGAGRGGRSCGARDSPRGKCSSAFRLAAPRDGRSRARGAGAAARRHPGAVRRSADRRAQPAAAAKETTAKALRGGLAAGLRLWISGLLGALQWER